MDPSAPPSFHWIRKLWPFKKLLVPSEVAQIQGELFDLRTQIDHIHRQQQKLNGKVYRGVALGDTVEPVRKDPEPSDQMVMPELPTTKAELYKRAAQLRRH